MSVIADLFKETCDTSGCREQAVQFALGLHSRILYLSCNQHMTQNLDHHPLSKCAVNQLQHHTKLFEAIIEQVKENDKGRAK